jgi:hypothetical protein
MLDRTIPLEGHESRPLEQPEMLKKDWSETGPLTVTAAIHIHEGTLDTEVPLLTKSIVSKPSHTRARSTTAITGGRGIQPPLAFVRHQTRERSNRGSSYRHSEPTVPLGGLERS